MQTKREREVHSKYPSPKRPAPSFNSRNQPHWLSEGLKNRGKTYDALGAGSIDGTDVVPHDHGIARALEAQCYFFILVGNFKFLDDATQDPKIIEDPLRTLFVGRLSFKVCHIKVGSHSLRPRSRLFGIFLVPMEK